MTLEYEDNTFLQNVGNN